MLDLSPLVGLVRRDAEVYVPEVEACKRRGDDGENGPQNHEQSRNAVGLGRLGDGVPQTRGEVAAQHAVAENAAVRHQHNVGQEVVEKPAVVLLADAVVDPYAVVVVEKHAAAAHGAVLGAGGPREPAGAARPGPEDEAVVLVVVLHTRHDGARVGERHQLRGHHDVRHHDDNEGRVAGGHIAEDVAEKQKEARAHHRRVERRHQPEKRTVRLGRAPEKSGQASAARDQAAVEPVEPGAPNCRQVAEDEHQNKRR